MKRVFINNDNLNFEDLDYEVIRVKGLIINDNSEILVAHNNGTYQLVGGHVETNEDMEEALRREILEETGINLNNIDGPFMQVMSYYKNYFDTGKNVCSKIYYYRICCNEMPDISKTNYDLLEQKTDFKLFYIPLREMEDFLRKGLEDKMIDSNIFNEMMLVIEEFIYLYERG